MTNLKPSKLRAHPPDVAVFAQKESGVLCKTGKMIRCFYKTVLHPENDHGVKCVLVVIRQY